MGNAAARICGELGGRQWSRCSEALARTDVACRQIVARARHRVTEGRPRLDVDRDNHRELVERFIAAGSGADVEGLRELLAEDIQLVSDGGSKRKAARHPIVGRDRVVRFVAAIVPRLITDGATIPIDVNGDPGFIVTHHGAVTLAATVEVTNKQLSAVRWSLNPEKLPRSNQW